MLPRAATAFSVTSKLSSSFASGRLTMPTRCRTTYATGTQNGRVNRVWLEQHRGY